MKYFYKCRLFEALGNVLLKASMTEILLSLLSVAPHLNSSTPSVSCKKTCGFICSLAVFENISVQLWDFEKTAPFYYESSCKDDSRPPARLSVVKFFIGVFFLCHKRPEWDTWEGGRCSVICACVSILTLGSVQAIYRYRFFKWTVYTSSIDNGDQQEPESPLSHMKMNRGMIQSIYRIMMNRPDALSLRRRCIHVVKMLLQRCSRSLCLHSPIFVPGLVDCGAGQGAA